MNHSILTLNFSLVKMVYKTAEEHGREPRWTEIEQAIRRNFGGLDAIDPVGIFMKHVPFSRMEMVGVLNNLFVLNELPLLCVHRIDGPLKSFERF